MMQFGFKNYDGFKELFVREDGNRKNGVLLSFFKNREIREWARKNKKLKKFLNIKSMGELYAICDEYVRETYPDNLNYLHILENTYRSDKYKSDRFYGVCEDGDFTAYRYINTERDNAVFKMKIGKMYKHAIECSEFGKLLNQQVVLFMCEEMARKWKADNASKYSGFQLHVDDDFEKIYSRRYYKGDFDSCMTDEDREDFYRYSVKAKAAYLTNEDGLIVARCVIYMECHDQNDKVWRLAERQYSSNGDDTLKLMLVYALIKGGHIDGYKKVGADCHSPQSFLDVNDNPIPDAKFWIKCDVDEDSVISYQDSFKYYDMKNRRAYNWENSSIELIYDLSTTDRYIDGRNDNWDEYHEEYTNSDVITVYYRGDAMTCSEDDLDDFRYVMSESAYYHEDDVCVCEECNDYYLDGDGYYSELTRDTYCCEDCLNRAEQTWKEDNWEYSEYDDEYFESVETFYRAIPSCKNYVETTISEDSLRELIDDGDVVERDGEYYEVSDYLNEWLAENE